MTSRGPVFGSAAEFLLIDADSCRPLAVPNLRFEELNSILETIDIGDFDQEVLDLLPFEVLRRFHARLETEHLPADEIIDLFERERSIPRLLWHLVDVR